MSLCFSLFSDVMRKIRAFKHWKFAIKFVLLNFLNNFV
ncbi:MAG: hypothetical protein CH6_0951 [Candidatus Kapaibacterium sp.]|nr:MAG: hypothetical protein CH6_0951 [Candidatus Kapabacteria bacterium]